MEGFIWVIIVGVIISVISSAAKKKKPAKSDEGEAPAAPVLPPNMSDIQKAFMLMNDFDKKEPKQAPPKPRYVHTEGTLGRTEGTASNEGMRGRTEGTLGRTEGIASNEGMRGRTEGTLGRTEGTASTEGMRGRTEGVSTMNAATSSRKTAATKNDAAVRQNNKYTNVKINKYFLDDDDEDNASHKKRRNTGTGLKLFENQSECVKAVIYSEIFTRKTARR